MLRVLHISDLHERASYAEMPPWRQPILDLDATERGYVFGDSFFSALSAIAREEVHLVCFTGDLADWGRPEEYQAATTRLDKILETVGVPRQRFFAVPGNHDIQRPINEAAWEGVRDWAARSRDFAALGRWMRRVGEPPGLDPEWREALAARADAFWNWLRDYQPLSLRESGDTDLGYRYTIQPGVLSGVDQPLNIIGLDSSWLCGGDDDQGKILLTEQQVQCRIRDGEGSLDGFSIALVHHPLDHLADHHNVRRLLGADTHLVLHGHQHDPVSLDVKEADTELRIVAAGCLIEGDVGRGWPNGFQLIEIDTDTGSTAVHLQKWAQRPRCWVSGSDIYREAPNGILTLPPLRSVSNRLAAAAVDSLLNDAVPPDEDAPTAESVAIAFYQLPPHVHAKVATELAVAEPGDQELSHLDRMRLIVARCVQRGKLADLARRIALRAHELPDTDAERSK